MEFKNILLTITDKIAHVSFNRPDKANALNRPAWNELKEVFDHLHQQPVRAVILKGEGKHFCSGIDLELLGSIFQEQKKDEARKREEVMHVIKELQDCVNAIEQCSKPVIAAVHGACIGGGVDIIAACDLRYGTLESLFSIKEIDVGMVADLGTLQRLPKIIPYAHVAELAYTGKTISGQEAASLGLLNGSFDVKSDLDAEVEKLALQISLKSPLSIRGIKRQLLYARDHSVTDSLTYMQTWNAAFFLSDDVKESLRAMQEKRRPTYED
jgi:enoyl-CoA hydratase